MEKSGVLEHKSYISLKRVKIEEKLQWRGYKSLTLFRRVPYPTPYGLLFNEIGVRNPHQKLQSLLSQERLKLRTANLVVGYIHRVHPNKSPLKILEQRERGCIQALRKVFKYPDYLRKG